MEKHEINEIVNSVVNKLQGKYDVENIRDYVEQILPSVVTDSTLVPIVPMSKFSPETQKEVKERIYKELLRNTENE